jgi:hypothetical protein
MSHDLLFKKSGRRNWARGNPATSAGPIPSSVLPASVKKIAWGTMIFGTLAGLAFIVSPHWKMRHKKIDPMKKRMYVSTASPSKRIYWPKRQ